VTGRAALAVDIGTTATKALALTPAGEVVAEASRGYPLSVPEPGAAEIDPGRVRRAALEAIGECASLAGCEIACLSFGSAMHTVIAVDEGGEALTGCLTFADERSARQAAELREGEQGSALYRRTGTPVQAMSPISKLRWLAEERRAVFERAARFVSIKEYVLEAMIDARVVDASTASGSGLYSLSEGDWDPAALALAGVAPDRLSKVVAADHAEQLMPSAAVELGLPAGTPVVIGAADGPLANLGVGVRDPAALAVTVGTSGAVRTTVDRVKTDPNAVLFCYVLGPSDFVVGGPVNNGGVVVRWLRKLLGGGERRPSLAEIDGLAKDAPPAAAGLVFLPFLTGERAPLWSAEARGVLFGLALEHGPQHVARAVMEGVAYSLRTVGDLVERLTGVAGEVRAGGGFVHSDLWVQIVADVLVKPIKVPAAADSSTVGAGLLGLAAVGEIDLDDVTDEMIGPMREFEPDHEHVEVYRHMLGLYGGLVGDLTEAFGAAAAVGFEHPKGGLAEPGGTGLI
jgi:gluconokinase